MTLSDLKRQASFKLENKSPSEAQGSPGDAVRTLANVNSDSSPSHSDSSEDLDFFQEMHIHLKDSRTNMQKQEESWIPKHALGNWWARRFPPVERKMSPSICKRGKYRGEDLGLEAFGAIRKSHPAEHRKLEEASKSLPQKSGFSSESCFKKKIREFLQWIDSRIKSTCQKSPVKERASTMSHDPPEVHELMEALGKILEEKLACKQQCETWELSKQKKELQAQAETDKAQPCKYGAVSDKQQHKRSSPYSYNQEAVFPGPSHPTGVTQIRDSVRAPQKTVSFNDHVSLQSQYLPPFSRKSWTHEIPCSDKDVRYISMPSHLLKTLDSEL